MALGKLKGYFGSLFFDFCHRLLSWGKPLYMGFWQDFDFCHTFLIFIKCYTNQIRSNSAYLKDWSTHTKTP